MMFCGIMMAQTKAGVSTEFIYGGFTLDRNRVIRVAQMNTDVYMEKEYFNKRERTLFMEAFAGVMESIAAGYTNKINYDRSMQIVWVNQPANTELTGQVVRFLNEICKELVERGEYIRK